MSSSIFFLELTQGDHKLWRTFYFIKISSVLTELWMIFCLMWCFAVRTGHFQLKQTWKFAIYLVILKWRFIFNIVNHKWWVYYQLNGFNLLVFSTAITHHWWSWSTIQSTFISTQLIPTFSHCKYKSFTKFNQIFPISQ